MRKIRKEQIMEIERYIDLLDEVAEDKKECEIESQRDKELLIASVFEEVADDLREIMVVKY